MIAEFENHLYDLRGERPFIMLKDDMMERVRDEWMRDARLVFFEGAEAYNWEGPVGGEFLNCVDSALTVR